MAHAGNIEIRLDRCEVGALYIQCPGGIQDGLSVSQSDSRNRQQADSCSGDIGPPQAKHARRTIISCKELEISLKETLNKSIKVENEDIFRFDGNLSTPAEEKYPELREWKMYDGQNQLCRTESAQELEQTRQDTESGLKIEMNHLFKTDTRFVAILGGPGSGKSTFVRRYGNKVLDGEIEGMKNISIVYFVDARRLATVERDISFMKFFFSKPVHGFDNIMDEATAWMRDEENQRKILVIIDGLDKLHNLVMDQPCRYLDYTDSATPSEILFNLLESRLLPKAKILAASRSYGIQNYERSARPQRTIALVGFSEENTKYLFREMMGPDVGKRWNRFSDTLKSLCSTPLYLVYVAIMQKSNTDLKTDDVSSILMCLIQNFWNRYGWEKDWEAFNAIKNFCLKELINGRVTFSTSDITNRLKKEHIMKLCNAVPETERGVMELSPDKNIIYFRHMLIQESLACLGFLDLTLEEYTEVLKTYIQTPFFSTVEQLACGILLNRRMQFEKLFVDISAKKEKGSLLLENLHQRISSSPTSKQMLHHLACLYEMGEPIEEPRILPDTVDVRNQDFTKFVTHITARAIAKCAFLSELVLYQCSLDSRKLKILWRCLRGSSLKIKRLNLGCNPNICSKGLKTVAKITCHCQVRHLDLGACELESCKMNKFSAELTRDGSEKIKLESLLLKSNPNLSEDGLDAVASVVDVAKLKKLDLGHCNVSAKYLTKMTEYNLRSLQVLILTDYMKQDNESRMTVVGNCTRDSAIEELHIDRCDLVLSDLVALEGSFNGCQIQLKVLNVSNNRNISSQECHDVLCRIITNYHIQKMVMDGCGFSISQERALEKELVAND